MIKTFLNHSLIYTIGNILTRGVSIFLIPIYTHYLSPSEYGIVDLFYILAALINLTIALEISQAIARFYQDTNSTVEKIEYTSTAFIFTLIMYSVYLIISVLFNDFWTLLLIDGPTYKYIFTLASFAIATNGIFYFTQNQLKWQLQAKDSTITSIIHVVIIVLVTIYLIIVKNMNIEGIFIAQIIGNTCGIFVAMLYARVSYQFIFHITKLKEMLHFSFPLVFSSISIFISLYIDRLFIKEFLGLNELGIYAIAYKFASITGLIMIGFQQSLTPLIYKHYQESDTPKSIVKIFNFFLLMALSILTLAILFSKDILILLTTSSYYTAAPIIPILIITLFLGNMYIFAPGISIMKKTKLVMYLSITNALLNIVFNLFLIPILGIMGAAIATLISTLIVLNLRFWLSQQYYIIPYRWVKIIILLTLTLIISYTVSHILSEITINNVIIKFVLFIVLTIGLTINIFGKKILFTKILHKLNTKE